MSNQITQKWNSFLFGGSCLSSCSHHSVWKYHLPDILWSEQRNYSIVLGTLHSTWFILWFEIFFQCSFHSASRTQDFVSTMAIKCFITFRCYWLFFFLFTSIISPQFNIRVLVPTTIDEIAEEQFVWTDFL